MTHAILVAHGLPSAPEEQERRMQALGVAVGRLAGFPVVGTTLARRCALGAAVGMRPDPLVYPLFISEGWFVSDELPRRLRRAGADRPRILPPYGLDAEVHALAIRRLREAVPDPARTTVLVAAHGSPGDPRPARAARVVEETIRRGGFPTVTTGFIDEAPYLADAARGLGRAVCLPFFARSAGHVRVDLPEALAAAGFDGPVLPPIGEDPETPRLIARTLARAAGRQGAEAGSARAEPCFAG